jgi:hypothetical protein
MKKQIIQNDKKYKEKRTKNSYKVKHNRRNIKIIIKMNKKKNGVKTK